MESATKYEVSVSTETQYIASQSDEANERFKDNAKANELVRGFYRKPFDVPEVKA